MKDLEITDDIIFKDDDIELYRANPFEKKDDGYVVFSADIDLSEEKLTRLIASFLRGLREREAELFMKRYYSLRTAADIAAEYGIGENHVRSELSKIRKKLRKYVGKEGRS